MVEAARLIVEVLVSEKVHVVAVLGFVHLGNLGQDKKKKELCEVAGRVNATKQREGTKTRRKENISLAHVYNIKFCLTHNWKEMNTTTCRIHSKNTN